MAPRIVYLSWPPSEIAGGIKLAFRHVEVLCEAGLDAVIAVQGARRPSWLETTAPMIDLSDLAAGEDTLVLPENHHEMLAQLANWPNRKLVFCQNQFMAFRGLDGQGGYADFGVSGIIAEGNHVADYCRRRFPSMPMTIVPVVIDHDLFHFQSQKRLQITFAPRKRPLEAAFIQDMFRAVNPDFRSIPWVEISGASEQQVAETLRNTAVYLSLCRFEAVPMTILEAFACGCLTAGFTGFGARQYTTTGNGFWAEEDNCIDCVDQLTRAVQLVTEGGPLYPAMLEAAHLSSQYYSLARLAETIVGFCRSYLDTGEFPATTS